jgi:anti-sigma factor RsiW
MNSLPPFEGDLPDDGGEDAPYEWLDEWLCEYVDGTMDPSLEAVFEQYVEANPELKAHVERLQETRDLLCECGLPQEAPPDLESEICTEVECDMLQSEVSVSDALWDRPLAAFGVASSVAAALVIGFLVGATMMGPAPSASPPTATSDPETPDTRPPTTTHPVQAPTASPSEVPPLLLRRSASPFSSADSSQSSSPLTTIGLP